MWHLSSLSPLLQVFLQVPVQTPAYAVWAYLSASPSSDARIRCLGVSGCMGYTLEVFCCCFALCNSIWQLVFGSFCGFAELGALVAGMSFVGAESTDGSARFSNLYLEPSAGFAELGALVAGLSFMGAESADGSANRRFPHG